MRAGPTAKIVIGITGPTPTQEVVLVVLLDAVVAGRVPPASHASIICSQRITGAVLAIRATAFSIIPPHNHVLLAQLLYLDASAAHSQVRPPNVPVAAQDTI